MVFFFSRFIRRLSCLLLILCAFSCTEEKFLFVFNRNSVQNFPADTPFVYSTEINIKASQSLSKNQKNNLLNTLPDYLDDSLRVARVQRFGIRYIIKNPAVFNTSHISHSLGYMNGYLASAGYYHASFSDSFYIDTLIQKGLFVNKKKRNKIQERAYTTITVDPGKVTIIDSLRYQLGDSILQRVTTRENSVKKSLIEPGKSPFSKPLIGNELDRLVSLYKNRGYMLISRDNLIAVADTVDPAVLSVSTDPFEQIKTVQQAAERSKENPVAKVVIKTRDINNDSTDLVDSSQLKQYRIGHIYYYPEAKYTDLPDSLMNQDDLPVLYAGQNFTVYGSRHLFGHQPLRQHTFLRAGTLYRENLYNKTINNLSSMGAWQNIDTRYRIQVTNSVQQDSVYRDSFKVKVDTVDFHFFMVPAARQNITVALEASRNTGDIFTSGNSVGIAVNATYLNRNVWHSAIQSTTTFRNGVELSLRKEDPLLKTFQSSLSHSYSFPDFILPSFASHLLIRQRERFDGVRTILGASAAYSERTDFFRIRQLVANWGYEWKLRNWVWSVKIPNVELYSLDTLPFLVNQLKLNPFLRNAFTTGSIISLIGNVNTSWQSKKHPVQTNFFRAAAEEAGGLSGNIYPWSKNIYRYIKGEAEYRKRFNLPTTAIAMRIFAGIGYNYGKVGESLPFYKQFYAGGPNSMRAWSLRQLGLGSSLLSDTAGSAGTAGGETSNVVYRDRFGDMQLEANFEYRYTIATFSSLKLGGALFADAGNIWNIKYSADNPKANFRLKNLGHDIAIGVGTGLRFDFNYFLVRIDGGIKLKDPARLANDGWLNIRNFTWQNHEFENPGAPNRNNYAVQLGIGLPF